MAAYVSARDVPTAERRFYFGMAIAMAATVFAGFARSFFLRPLFADFAAHNTPPEAWFYVHGRLHPVTGWGALAFILTGLLRSTISQTAAWTGAMHWAAALLG